MAPLPEGTQLFREVLPDGYNDDGVGRAKFCKRCGRLQYDHQTLTQEQIVWTDGREETTYTFFCLDGKNAGRFLNDTPDVVSIPEMISRMFDLESELAQAGEQAENAMEKAVAVEIAQSQVPDPPDPGDLHSPCSGCMTITQHRLQDHIGLCPACHRLQCTLCSGCECGGNGSAYCGPGCTLPRIQERQEGCMPCHGSGQIQSGQRTAVCGLCNGHGVIS